MMGSFKQCLLVLIACLLAIVVAQSSSATSDATETQPSNSTIIPSSSIATPSIGSPPSNSILPSTTSDVTNAVPTVQSTGFNSNGNEQSGNQQSWLRQNNRFVFIIFIGLIVLSILIWYIYRSVKGMRKRLEQENQAHLYMMQQATSPGQPCPPQNRNDRVIPEITTQSPPPAYKVEEHIPATHPPADSQRY